MSDSNGQERVDRTVENVSEHFGVSIRTVRRWLKSTDIPHRRVGGIIRFSIDEVDEWMKDRAEAASDPTPDEQEVWEEVRAQEVAKRKAG